MINGDSNKNVERHTLALILLIHFRSPIIVYDDDAMHTPETLCGNLEKVMHLMRMRIYLQCSLLPIKHPLARYAHTDVWQSIRGCWGISWSLRRNAFIFMQLPFNLKHTKLTFHSSTRINNIYNEFIVNKIIAKA